MDIYSVANQMKLEHKTIQDLKIRVTFYARVSTTREEQENSIEHQIEFFTNMIKNNPNWTFVEGYIDRIRGESAENRKQFMQMIEDGKNGEFDLVLTKEVSRFARNTIDSLTYTRDLLRAGVGVYFQNDNICTIDTDSELRLTIMSSIAADEVRKLSERVRWGHKRSIESGRVLGNNRIFGYDYVNCKLIINEKEAEMVRMIFELYSTGDYSVRKIENILYDKGYRGRNGTRIHHNTISGIIQNPKYKGYFCGNKVKITDYRTKEQRFLPEEEWIMYKDETGDTVPAIVSEEIWDRCNIIFKERSTAIKSRERSFKDKSILTGKIWCGVHDKPFWRATYSNSASRGTPTYAWICSEKKRFGTKTCSSFSILESELYELLSNVFKDAATNIEDYIKTFMEIYKSVDSDGEGDKRVKQLKSDIEKEQHKKDKLLELYMDSAITKSEFKERNDVMNERIENIKSEITEIENQKNDFSDYAVTMKQIEQYFKTMYMSDNIMDKTMVDEMVKVILDRIDVIPIDSVSMELQIKLKTGMNEPITYIRNGGRYGCRSGHMSNRISPKQQYKFNRNAMKNLGKRVEVTYDVVIGI